MPPEAQPESNARKISAIGFIVNYKPYPPGADFQAGPGRLTISTMSKAEDYKSKFRPQAKDSLDAQLDAALSGLSEDDLYGSDAPQAPAPKGSRRGKIVSVGKEDVFVDL